MKSKHIIALYELYNSKLEFKNEVKDVLSQYTFLNYSIREEPNVDSLTISFSKDITPNYVAKILSSFQLDFISKQPVTVKVIKKKNIEDFENHDKKPVIGNIETVSFPTLKLGNIEAKVDSGATCSCLATSLIEISKDKQYVSFIPLNKDCAQYTGVKYKMKIHELVKVQSSNGEHQVRPLVKLAIVLKNKTVETYFSLTDRSKLEYPILLGKDLLSGYLIDASFI